MYRITLAVSDVLPNFRPDLYSAAWVALESQALRPGAVLAADWGHSWFGLWRATIEPSGDKTLLLDQTGGFEVHEHLVATGLRHGDTFDGMTRERM
jgi:hypothetical protein